MPAEDSNRRPLKTRSAAWAQHLAAILVRAGASPNAISITSVLFAVAGAVLLLRAATLPGLLAAALCIQLRLLCNMLDGMVAIEGGLRSATGALYNEIPDRIGDSLFIVALGYAAAAPAVGWYGALVAAVTAYIRVLGGALGQAQDFRGPMAKPHRMFVATLGCIAGAVEVQWNGTHWSLLGAAWIIAIGATLTCVTRTAAIARRLGAAGP
ncbi:MAG TPA: CDP-alcohol phosphatidyltransferase family protein [Steroidobacteraceae bacterium]|nr:CDP-alcohol phosphatidyltransferase family protein [Steroidobacteraceae bacterium]